MTQSLVVVVTGAGSGIGRAVALRFAKDGARVALAARHKESLERVAKDVAEAGGEALVQPTDVADDAQVQALADAVRGTWGVTHVLVNAAGVGRYGFVKDMPVEDFDEQIATNLRGPFLVAKAFLPLMLDGDGERSIVNVASVSGTMGMPGQSGYCASKFGLRGFSESLAAEVSDAGIRVVAVNPGYVDTPMVAGARVKGSDMIHPDDLADFVHYLHRMPASLHVDDVTVYPHRLHSQ